MFKTKLSFDIKDFQIIISACMCGEHLAQESLFNMFFSYAHKVCLPYVSSKEELEEVINDGFLKIFYNLFKYDQSRPFKSWIKSIMVNTAIDHYRKTVKGRFIVNKDYFDVVDKHEYIVNKILTDEILLLVQNLPAAYRMVFNLYVIEGYTHPEIAELLNIGVGTSKSNLRDARKKLQKAILENQPQTCLAWSFRRGEKISLSNLTKPSKSLS